MSYDAQDIQVLEGLEAVRRRPGMYIGSTGPSGLHHLVYEVVDNSVDEAMAGYCSLIYVTLTADGGVEVIDDGRGIPVGRHPQYGEFTAAEVVLTMLHAGGKFGGAGYKVSGGLHGVGVSVVNALSERIEIEIDRDGQRYAMSYRDGGQPVQRLSVVGAAPDGRTGTTVRFWPDPTIFEDITFTARTLTERLQMMAYLNRGLRIVFTDLRPGSVEASGVEATGADGNRVEGNAVDGNGAAGNGVEGNGTEAPAPGHVVEFYYEGGISDFVHHLNATREPLFSEVGWFSAAEEDGEVELAFQWNTGFQTDGLHSFANGINTVEGGMHEEGFRKALTMVVNRYAREKGLLKEKEENLLGEDIREGLVAIISVKLREPQFEGQTKGKLGNVSIRSLVERATNDRLAQWLEEHPSEGRRLVTKALQAARARMAAREARNAIRRKSALTGAGMPDKLKDCNSRNPDECELFIVEGDSAGGSAVRARDPRTQAVLPIRGKILNVERARADKMLKNIEIQTLITAIGAGLGEEYEITKARYHKIIILADADVDGSHIRTLLLTFFFRQMRPLVESGYVYIAQPPLYSTEVGKAKIYLKDDVAKNVYAAENAGRKLEFQRLKGLGEMDWEELRETTMDRDRRTLVQVSLEQAIIADEITSILMGENVDERKAFIVTNAREVRNLDF